MVRLLTNNDKEIVLKYLERNHMECTFLIGNVLEYGFENNNELRRCGDYYGYFEENELKGILPFYNLGSCIPHFESDKAISAFADLMKNRQFKYLLGMKRYIKPLYDEIQMFKTTINYSEDSYFINNNIKPYTKDNINFFEFDKLNMDDALHFVIEARRGFDEEIDKKQAFTLVTQRPEDEDFIFEMSNGKIVAQACIQTVTSKICQIGAVYTTPSERGKGYCKAIVSELCQRINKRNKIPTLMVTNNNTPAVQAYTSLGFEYYDDYLLITFE